MNQYEVGAGRTRLRLSWSRQGADIRLHISGGEDHVGAVALAGRGSDGQAYLEVLRLKPHREEVLVRRAAERLREAIGATVCVTAGVHLDRADAGEIETIISNSEAGVSRLIGILAGDPDDLPARSQNQ